ncbi:MAG: hypothetical protein Q8N98_03415 [bacterium]|nr:hypothetical protein [bacterium]
MKPWVKELGIFFLLAAIANFIVWLPFFTKIIAPEGMARVLANYDASNYMAVSRCFYNQDCLKTYPLNNPVIYYAAHFPLYPLTGRLVGYLPGLYYPGGLLAATLLATATAGFIFYRLLKDFGYGKKPFVLAGLFLLFPGRWLVTHSIPGPEPLFIAAILSSLYFFKKENYLAAGIFGAMAQLTKSPGALLFLAYGFYFLYKSKVEGENIFYYFKKAWPLILMPLSLLGLFSVYHFSYNDFFAYFHSGDNIHLQALPFRVFDSTQPWVGTFWLEDVLWVYLIAGLAVWRLWEKRYVDLAIFAAIFFAATLFVSHRDVSRYCLPLLPFVLIAFEEFLTGKTFLKAFIIILPAVFLYAINFVAGNFAPIVNWEPFL